MQMKTSSTNSKKLLTVVGAFILASCDPVVICRDIVNFAHDEAEAVTVPDVLKLPPVQMLNF